MGLLQAILRALAEFFLQARQQDKAQQAVEEAAVNKHNVEALQDAIDKTKQKQDTVQAVVNVSDDDLDDGMRRPDARPPKGNSGQ